MTEQPYWPPRDPAAITPEHLEQAAANLTPGRATSAALPVKRHSPLRYVLPTAMALVCVAAGYLFPHPQPAPAATSSSQLSACQRTVNGYTSQLTMWPNIARKYLGALHLGTETGYTPSVTSISEANALLQQEAADFTATATDRSACLNGGA